MTYTYMGERATTKQVFRELKASDNPVTKSVLRDILIKRFEANGHVRQNIRKEKAS